MQVGAEDEYENESEAAVRKILKSGPASRGPRWRYSESARKSARILLHLPLREALPESKSEITNNR